MREFNKQETLCCESVVRMPVNTRVRDMVCMLCVCEEFYEELRPTAGNESAKLDIDKARENTSKSIFMCVRVALSCAVVGTFDFCNGPKPKYMPGSISPT